MGMFQSVENIDALEQQLLESERLIGEVRRRLADVIPRLDAARVTLVDGARTLTERGAAAVRSAPSDERHRATPGVR